MPELLKVQSGDSWESEALSGNMWDKNHVHSNSKINIIHFQTLMIEYWKFLDDVWRNSEV